MSARRIDCAQVRTGGHTGPPLRWKPHPDERFTRREVDRASETRKNFAFYLHMNLESSGLLVLSSSRFAKSRALERALLVSFAERGWSRGGVSKVICITLRHRSDPAALVALSWRTKWGGGMPRSVSHEVVTRLAVRLLRMWWHSRMCNAVKW